MDETVSIYIIRIKGSSYYTLAQFFPEFHTWVRFSVKDKQYVKRDMRRSRKEVFPYAASFVSLSCLKVDTKNGCVGGGYRGTQREILRKRPKNNYKA